MEDVNVLDYNGIMKVTLNYGKRKIVVSGCYERAKAIISETDDDGTITEIALYGTIEELVPQLKILKSQSKIR